MISKIKSILVAIALTISISLPIAIAVPAIASAADTGALCDGAAGSIGNVSASVDTTTCGSGTGNDVNNTIALVLNLFSAIVGIIAVIMIIIGGLRYITSGGSSEKTTSAKDTILFAIVGLVIVALAQVIVKFVLNKASAL